MEIEKELFIIIQCMEENKKILMKKTINQIELSVIAYKQSHKSKKLIKRIRKEN